MGGLAQVLAGGEAQVRGTDGRKGGYRLLPLDGAKLAPLSSTCEQMCVHMGPRVFTHTHSVTFLSPSSRLFPPLF